MSQEMTAAAVVREEQVLPEKVLRGRGDRETTVSEVSQS